MTLPDLRALLVSIGVGAGIAAYTILWWHWPVAIGAGLGIVAGGVVLIGGLSIGGDPAAADAAWREAAPDLQEPTAEPIDVPVHLPTAGDERHDPVVD